MSYLNKEITVNNYNKIILNHIENKKSEIKVASRIIVIILYIIIDSFYKNKNFEKLNIDISNKKVSVLNKNNNSLFNEEKMEVFNSKLLTCFNILNNFIFLKPQELINDNICKNDLKKIRDNFFKITIEKIKTEKEISDSYKEDIDCWNNNIKDDSIIFVLDLIIKYKKEKILNFKLIDLCFMNDLPLLLSKDKEEFKVIDEKNLMDINLLLPKASVEIRNLIKEEDFIKNKNINQIKKLLINNMSFSLAENLQKQNQLFIMNKEKDKLSNLICNNNNNNKKRI